MSSRPRLQHLQTWAMAAALLANASVLVWAATLAQRPSWGYGLALAGLAVGASGALRRLGRSQAMQAVALVSLVLAQPLVFFGAATPMPEWLFLNQMLSLGLLLVLRNPWAVLAAGSLSLAAGVPLGWYAAPAPGAIGWPHLLVMALHTAAMAAVARQSAHLSRQSFDIEFLVRAMGAQGPIRLALGAVRVETGLGQRLQQVQQRMAGVLGQARAAVGEVQRASVELHAGGEDLRERTSHAAQGMRDAAMTLEQITVIVKGSAQAALQARSMAESASAQAAEGGQLFGQVTGRMQEIHRASQRITDIIGVIDGIAFQTNILALNAAVEAARAGDQGRGFAVVAQEVRQLALRSSQAAAEIKQLIEGSSSTIREGTALVDSAGQAMERIIASVRKVGEVFASLSADTTEHAGSIEAVTRSVMEVDESTQRNVGLAETTQRIARELLEQGQALDESLGSFKLRDGMSSGEQARAAASEAAVKAKALLQRAAAAPTPAAAATPTASSSPVDFF